MNERTIEQQISALWVDNNLSLWECARRVAALEATPEGRELVRQREEQAQRLEQEDRAAAEARHRQRLFEGAGVPVRPRVALRPGVLYETAATARVWSWLAARREDPGLWCLVLAGDVGVGKSVAAALWMRELRASAIASRDGRAGESRRLPSWWPISVFARIDRFDGSFDALCAHDGPVVLDDLGTEYLDEKGWFRHALDAFVDARYAGCLPTLITTNVGVDDHDDEPGFAKIYGSRVTDRLHEGGAFYECTGPSLRGRE